MSPDKIVKNLELKFRGQNLFLWPGKPEHAKDILSAVKESIEKLNEFLPWSLEPETLVLSEQIKRLAKANYDFYNGNSFLFHLYNEDYFLGSFGLHRRTLNPNGLELGYWVRTGAIGRGLATVASQALIVFAIEVLDCERMQCGYNENNFASGKVNQKIGFIKEGILARYEPTPAPISKMGAGMVLGRLLKEEARALPWYEAIKKSCQFNMLFRE